MREYYPLIIVGGIVGLFSVIFIVAYMTIRSQKEAIGFDRNMKDSEIIKRLFCYAKPHYKGFLLVLLLMLFSIAQDILSPLIIGDLEETIKDSFTLNDLYLRVGIYVGVLILSLTATYFQSIILQKIGQKILSKIRLDVFTHIESLSHEQLNHIPTGTLVTRVANDTGAISMMFTNILVNLIKNCFVVIGVLIAMLCLNYMFTLMVLCFVPFIVLFTMIFRKFTRKAYRKVKDGVTGINTYLSENLSGMKIIQIFNREERKKEEFEEKNRKLCKAKEQQILTFGIFRPIVYMLYISSVMVLFFLAGKGYIDEWEFLGQTVTGGVVVSFYMFISKFFNPIQSLAEQFNWLQSAFASAEKIFTILDMKPEVVDEPDATELSEIKGDIEFKNVWFAYEKEDWVLKDVSFKISAGETIAFVGATGSGKTTILSLICRNYDIQKGQILIDGVDIKKIKISSLRSHFGQMLQDVFLFSGTVRSNILLNKGDVSDEKVMEVCRYVNADKLIAKLPGGLDEQVRERGNNFSSGERQLISFARAIIHDPKIMILDEATANIDTETEQLIQDSLEKLRQIGTFLIVAHRLSTVRNADRIYYLANGQIMESGSHEELLELHGKYYELYTLQIEKERLKG